MTRFDVAVLSFRILALYFLLEALIAFSSLAFFLRAGFNEASGGNGLLLSWVVSLLALLLLGCALFAKAPAIARRLFPESQPMSTATRPEIGALALKLCGILLFANCLTRIGREFGFTADADQASAWSTLAVRIGLSALPGVLAVVVFLAAPRLASRMFGNVGAPLPASIHANVQAVAFSVLGIWLFVNAVSALGESVRERMLFGAWGRGWWPQAALAALGLALFLGGAGLSGFWYWVRHAGLNSRTERPA